MDKKVFKIGMIMVLTLALILSSLGGLNFDDTFVKKFDVANDQAAKNAGGGGVFSQPKNGNLTIDENSFSNNKITAEAATTSPVWTGGVTPISVGNGTASNPYQISTGEELAFLAQQVNSGTSYISTSFKLMSDIVLNEGKLNASSRRWTPIGGAGYTFQGIFNGDGHTVSGVFVGTTGSDSAGLFGSTYNPAFISNLGVINSSISSSGGAAAGGIVGSNNASIYNCYSTASIGGARSWGGGIVGRNRQDGTVRNCYYNGYMGDGGSIVGYNEGAVRNCYFGGSKATAISQTPAKVLNCLRFDENKQFTETVPANQGAIGIIRGDYLIGTLNRGTGTGSTALRWLNGADGYPSFGLRIDIDETANSPVDYDGNAKAYTVSGTDSKLNFTIRYRIHTDVVSASYNISTPINANSYDVQITRSQQDPYLAFETTIPNGLVINSITADLVWADADNMVYDKQAKVPKATVNNLKTQGATTDTCVVTIVKNNGDNVNAGKFTYKATALGNSNYKLPTNVISKEFTINKSPLKKITVEKKYIDGGNANFSLTLATTNCEGFVNGDNLSITFATSSPNGGTYTGAQILNLQITGDTANYSVVEADITAKILSNPLPEITGIPAAGVTYNGAKQPVTPELAGLTKGTDYTLAWTYSTDGGKTFVDLPTPEFKNAGIYRVSVTGIGTYIGSNKVVDYTIKKIEVTLTWTPTNTVYDGTPKTPALVVGGVLPGDTFAVTAGLTSDAMSNITVGKFTFTATAPSNVNYELPTIVVSGECEITKPTDGNAWKDPIKPLTMSDVYVGGKLNPIAEPKYGIVDYKYYKFENDVKGELIPDPTSIKEVGTYCVTAQVIATASYDGIPETEAVSFQLKKRQIIDDGGSSSSSGGISSENIFWMGVVVDIKNKDDLIVEKECDYPTMPKKVLDALKESNKTLNITMQGEALSITSEKAKTLTFDKSSYTIEELKAMLADKPAVTPTPTEKPTDPTVPETPAANLTWLWVLLGILALSIVIAVVIVVRKKK